jgi:hypothetical protein
MTPTSPHTAELQLASAFAYAAPLTGVVWLAVATRVFNASSATAQSAWQKASVIGVTV